MSDKRASVVLVTLDDALARQVKAAAPAQLDCYPLTPSQVMGITALEADQLWIDLDFVAAIPANLRAIPDRVYLCSRLPDSSGDLPPGLVVKKPLCNSSLAALWAAVEHEAETGEKRLESGSLEASVTQPAGSLPDWIGDLHEIELAELSRRIVRLTPAKLGFEHASLYLRSGLSETLGLAETTLTDSVDLAIRIGADASTFLGRVATAGETLRTDDLSASCGDIGLTPPMGLNGPAHANALLMPLIGGGQLCGLLVLTGKTASAAGNRLEGGAALLWHRLLWHRRPAAAPALTGNAESAAGVDDARLASIAGFLGRSVDFAQRHELAKIEARIDGLTGLFNYRWAAESLEREIGRSARYGTPLSIALLDLDGLKPVNDRLGHSAGDAVLRHVAGRVRSILRQIDAAARIGGDEFVVILPATDLPGARHVAERIAAAVSGDPACHNDKLVPVRVSVGVAQWQPGWDTGKLIDAADQAMYEIKRTARTEADCAIPAASRPPVAQP
ncbi:MAG: GGDEF domain-containing protein [Planctomycetes bacterium]|nr:GGDEF domain-containing protein [Planctomycetota bacterium]